MALDNPTALEILSAGTGVKTKNYALTMNKLTLAFVGAVLAATAVALVIQQHAQIRLQRENESLRQQLDQLSRLPAENEQLSNRLAQAKAAAEAPTAELLKLRNEVGMLRKQAMEMTDLRRKNQQLSDVLARNRDAQLDKMLPVAAPRISAPDSAAVATNTPDFANVPDLGAVELVSQTPARFDLGGGKSCTLTPAIAADGNYNIKVVFEARMADGSTEITEAEITTRPGQPVALEAGGNTIAFTPTVNPAP